MKHVGTTNAGWALVELTPEEALWLRRAQNAVDGFQIKWIEFAGSPEHPKERDLAPLFKALELWVVSKMGCNQLEALLADYKKVLGL